MNTADQAIKAIHNLIRRVITAETTLQTITTEWNNLTHTDRITIDDIAPDLAAVLCQTESRLPT